MKTVILIIFQAISQESIAFELPFGNSKYETKDAKLKKYLDFVKKDDRCDFVVAIAPRSSATKALKGIYE